MSRQFVESHEDCINLVQDYFRAATLSFSLSEAASTGMPAPLTRKEYPQSDRIHPNTGRVRSTDEARLKEQKETRIVRKVKRLCPW